ncbi:helix-turn-helix domain-containing protein [Actinomadura kijaniata]|uniref:helix-turn-helix domain-containing protein n=1 Tax=Actinomadura kijaniata TaxID=46161 RepID=UPI00082BE69B|nr:helix-turn-helix transcriptional regulator [Actinomadura kijaniata]
MSRPPKPIDGTKSIYATFAYALRWWRESKGLTQDGLAKELYMARSTIQAYEAQEYEPDEEFAKKLDAYFGAGRLFYYLWYHSQREYLLERWEDYLRLEPQSVQIRSFHPSTVPGLFQTEAYMRALFQAAYRPEAVTEEWVGTRLERQKLLERSDPPLFWSVIDESALLRRVGGKEVMKEQLTHVLKLMAMPNVAIQVVPLSAGSYPGQSGHFVLLHLPERVVAYEESQSGPRLLQDPTIVRQYLVTHDQIRLKALPEEATRQLIVESMEGLG